MSRVFANGQGDWVSIPGPVIPMTRKVVLDAVLLNTQYKVRIKGRVEQSREWSSAFPYILVVVTIEKGAFGSFPILLFFTRDNLPSDIRGPIMIALF